MTLYYAAKSLSSRYPAEVRTIQRVQANSRKWRSSRIIRASRLGKKVFKIRKHPGKQYISRIIRNETTVLNEIKMKNLRHKEALLWY